MSMSDQNHVVDQPSLTDENRVRPEPSFEVPEGPTADAGNQVIRPVPGFEDLIDDLRKRGFNRGGRPRKDGTRADDRTTLKDLGIGKREAARMRLFARVSHDVFEAALATKREAICNGKHVPSMESLLLADRNDGYQRELVSCIRRIISSSRRILRATEFDADADGLRDLANLTIEMWSSMLCEEDAPS